jgi:hypothetical protein
VDRRTVGVRLAGRELANKVNLPLGDGAHGHHIGP